MEVKIKKLIDKDNEDIILYEVKISPEHKRDDLLKFKELKEDFHFENYFDKNGDLRILF